MKSATFTLALLLSLPNPGEGTQIVSSADYQDGPRGSSTTITLGAVGDVLMHSENQVLAFQSDSGHTENWYSAKSLLAKPDIMYANLEGPISPGSIIVNQSAIGSSIAQAHAHVCEHNHSDPGPYFDGFVHTSAPRFNYHRSLAVDLVKSGVDIVSTANNHAMDRCRTGVKRTIDSLTAAGLQFVGTRKLKTEPWHAVTVAKGVRVAWLACTFINVGNPSQQSMIKAASDIVMDCSKTHIVDLVKDLAADKEVDAIIVTPHWGAPCESLKTRCATAPQQYQREWAKAWLEAGAIAVLGSHSHMLNPGEHYTTQNGRKTFISYSLGNFGGHEGWNATTTFHLPEDTNRKLHSMAYLTFALTKHTDRHGQVAVFLEHTVRYVPMYLRQRMPTLELRCRPGDTECKFKCPNPYVGYRPSDTTQIPKNFQACNRYDVRPTSLDSTQVMAAGIGKRMVRREQKRREQKREVMAAGSKKQLVRRVQKLEDLIGSDDATVAAKSEDLIVSEMGEGMQAVSKADALTWLDEIMMH